MSGCFTDQPNSIVAASIYWKDKAGVRITILLGLNNIMKQDDNIQTTVYPYKVVKSKRSFLLNLKKTK